MSQRLVNEMAIIEPSDRPTYFPEVLDTVPLEALQGYCILAQAFCESHWGANRPLELQQHIERVLLPGYDWGRVSYLPIASITRLEVRVNLQASWHRGARSEWLEIPAGSYEFEATTGRFELAHHRATEARVTYEAGYDFSNANDPDVQAIKGVAGAMVNWAARRHIGQLDSYLVNRVDGADANGIDTESWNFTNIQQVLKESLMPLRRYAARTG